ncbi:hypothetical protein BLOT_007462 [Blomia tropicalis]|nr:hypothetical protein BLOT_007462 [Blomia tropicalis]
MSTNAANWIMDPVKQTGYELKSKYNMRSVEPRNDYRRLQYCERKQPFCAVNTVLTYYTIEK